MTEQLAIETHQLQKTYNTGKEDEVETQDLAERAVEIYEKVLGPESVEVGRALHRAGVIMFDAGNYDYARTIQSPKSGFPESDSYVTAFFLFLRQRTWS